MQKIKILIVDDQPVFRKTLRVLFQQKDNIEWVEEAGNGRECLELLPNKSFDIILMDIQMPVMDGIQATKLVNSKYPGTKILGMSMYASISDVIALKKAGASGFVKKGLAFKELLNIIEKVIDGGRDYKNFETQNKELKN